MALKIQLRRDIAANWTTNNPLLLNGEVGIETDTLKFKVGNGTQRWNSLSSYALKPGEPNGVATLDSLGKVPLSQLPDQISLDAEAALAIQNALSTISTTSITEGTNLYFTNTRARTAVEGLFDQIGSSAQALSAANAHTGAKFQDAITAASADATVKTNSAVTLAGQNADQKINTAILSLSTSVIPEGINLYFTNQRVSDIVTPLINNTRTYIDESLANFEAPSAISSTTQLPEGSNLYFTNARAISATNAARLTVLQSALSSVDDLRAELRTDIDSKIPYSDRNTPGGVVGLDLNSKIQDSIIPSTIARTSDITSAIADIVNLAPDSLNTLGELATAFLADQNENGLSALITTVGTKLDSSLAATTYAPINSPTFTGTPIIPGYATSINLTAGITEAKDYTDLAIEGINNSLGGYQPEAEKNQASGYAGLDSNSQILESVIPSAITTSIAAKASVNGTYANGMSSSNPNKITYGTSLTPPSSGNSAGDIYIQY